MSKDLQALFGLKWNPFLPELPSEALFISPRIEHFGFRLEGKVREGGFALITGAPGTGKSVSLRILAERLSGLRDVTVGVVSHPQSGVSDFYRELGDLFGVPLAQRNRWGSFKSLREKWQAHIEATLMRPVLLVDEAQEMGTQVLGELRILSSAHFDSRCLLTTVFCGDARLTERLSCDELVALGSRIRPRRCWSPPPPPSLRNSSATPAPRPATRACSPRSWSPPWPSTPPATTASCAAWPQTSLPPGSSVRPSSSTRSSSSKSSPRPSECGPSPRPPARTRPPRVRR